MQWHIISILYAHEFIFADGLIIYSLCLHFDFPYTTLHTSQHGQLVILAHCWLGALLLMLMKCLSTIGWIGEKHTHQKMFSNNDLSCGHGHLLQVPVCQRKTLYFRESGTLLSRSKCTVSLGTPLFLTSTPTLLYTTLHFCLFVAVVVVVIGRRLVLNGHSKHIKIWGWVLTIFDQGTQLVDLHYCVNWLTPSTPV